MLVHFGLNYGRLAHLLGVYCGHWCGISDWAAWNLKHIAPCYRGILLSHSALHVRYLVVRQPINEICPVEIPLSRLPLIVNVQRWAYTAPLSVI